jgi:hypothetical protein
MPDRVDHRAWDAMVFGDSRRTAVELEMRIRDAQAVERRIGLKRRDDPPDGFMLLVADTRANRHLLTELPGLFAELPRLRTATVLRLLEVGRHPPSGIVLI